MFTIEPLRELYRHMEWADAGLWHGVSALDRPLENERFGSLLFHVHYTQRAFLQVWTGQRVDRYEPSRFPTPGDLQSWVRSYYGEVDAFLRTLDDADLVRPTTPPWARMFEKQLGRAPAIASLGETLFQVTSHSTHHRAQLNTMLREMGTEPPMVDYIAWIWSGRPAPAWG